MAEAQQLKRGMSANFLFRLMLYN